MFLPVLPISLIHRSIIVYDFSPSRLLIVLELPFVSIPIGISQYPLDDISVLKNTFENTSIMKKIFPLALKVISLPVSSKHVLVGKLVDALPILFVVLVDFADVDGGRDVFDLNNPVFEGGFALIVGEVGKDEFRCFLIFEFEGCLAYDLRCGSHKRFK